jgi:hypothetical protein
MRRARTAFAYGPLVYAPSCCFREQFALDDGDRAAGEQRAVAAEPGADAAGAGRGLEAGEIGAAETLGPEGGQGRVGAARDRVLVDADVREEAA